MEIYRRYVPGNPSSAVQGFTHSVARRPDADPCPDQSALAFMAQKYPEKTQLRQITKTHGGRQILAIGIGDGLKARDSRPAFLLNSGHHGNEPMSILFLVDAIRELLEGEQGKYALLTQNSQIWIVPVLNADGYVRHMDESTGIGRKNGRRTHEGGHKKSGVDLNRNYPIRWGATGERGSHSNHSSAYYRGPSAGSEPETRGMMKLARDIPFVGSISYHSGPSPSYPPTPSKNWRIQNKMKPGACRGR